MKKIIAIALPVLLLLNGCGSSGSSTAESKGEMSDGQRYEGDFQPSQFDPDPDVILGKSAATKLDSVTPHQTAPDPDELVSGFRVQIFSTTNIDDANNARDSAAVQFSVERFYVVYDPPTYKIRGGDFLTRYEADKFARQLRERGYRDAWVVPEKVRANSTPR